MSEENKEKKDENKTQIDASEKPVKKSYTGAIIAALLSGVAIGVITGILIAPKKGTQTRKEIKDRSLELIDISKKTISDTVDKTKEFTKESAGKFDKIKNIIAPNRKSKKKKVDKEVKQ